jgi:hypothetical protein
MSSRGLSTYVTIDLDSWASNKVDIDFLDRTLSRVPNADRAAAIHHDSILPHVRRYARCTKRLWNLDSHSDLGGCLDAMFETGKFGLRRLELHSASWVDYVVLNDRQEFVWAYLTPECLANGRTDHFSLDHPFRQVQQIGRNPWRKIRHVLVKPSNYGLSGAKIAGVSIVLSPDFCGADAFGAFVDLVRRHDLELMDCLPENLEAEWLRSLGERLKNAKGEPEREESFTANIGWEVPRGSLRFSGFPCRTLRDRRRATKLFLAKLRLVCVNQGEHGKKQRCAYDG